MPSLARYVEEQHDSGDGAWLFAYVLLLFVGAKYVIDEMKKGGGHGAKAVAIVGCLAVAAFMFPIINGILVLVAALAFAYGILTTGRK